MNKKQACHNCGHSNQSSQPYRFCEKRRAYFLKSWHCCGWEPIAKKAKGGKSHGK